MFLSKKAAKELLEKALNTDLREDKFVKSLSNFYKERGFLSKKQLEVLQKILDDNLSPVDDSERWFDIEPVFGEIGPQGITDYLDNHLSMGIFYGDEYEDA